MSKLPSTPESRNATIVQILSSNSAVTFGIPGKKGFGSSARCVSGKIFAFLSSTGRFVVKLPRHRVDALVTARMGEHFEPGYGRVMKEWLVVEDPSGENWLALA